MTATTPLYLITVTNHVQKTDTILFYASSPYEAKKTLLKACMAEARRVAKSHQWAAPTQESPYFYGQETDAPPVGTGCVVVKHAEAGNGGHVLQVEEVTTVETGYVRSVPHTEREVVQTFRIHSVAPFDPAKLEEEEEEEESPDDGDSESDEETATTA